MYISVYTVCVGVWPRSFQKTNGHVRRRNFSHGALPKPAPSNRTSCHATAVFLEPAVSSAKSVVLLVGPKLATFLGTKSMFARVVFPC